MIGAIPKVKKCAIFVSRLDPEMTVAKAKEFVSHIVGGAGCVVEKLKTKYNTYASFYVSCDFGHRDVLLDADMWESGVLVRPFYGAITPAEQSVYE